MNKQEAATFLGVSERALQRYTQQGRISTRYIKGKTRPTPEYDEEELERFKVELSGTITHSPKVLTSEMPPDPDTALARIDRNSQAPDLAALLLTRAFEGMGVKLRPAVPIEHKTLLTLTEAQAVTGLSRSILRQAIEAGTLKAKTIGKAWRVKRSDLDIYIESL